MGGGGLQLPLNISSAYFPTVSSFSPSPSPPKEKTNRARAILGVVRPFTAFLRRIRCPRSPASAGGEPRRRLSLEELLKLEASDRIAKPDVESEEEGALVVLPKAPRGILDARRTEHAPVELAVLLLVRRLGLGLAAVQARSRALTVGIVLFKGSSAERKLGSGEELLFYQRRIPMGRRCRVQHLEECPYA